MYENVTTIEELREYVRLLNLLEAYHLGLLSEPEEPEEIKDQMAHDVQE